MSGSPASIEVFCSYAHADERWRQKLDTHLSPLVREGLISTWYDRQIVPGTDWITAIDTHLETASVILLLISPDFFASDYCYGIEMKRALERHHANEARVIPIVLRPVNWQGASFARLQALPTNAKAITTWSNRDLAFADVAVGIRQAIEDLRLSPGPPHRSYSPSITMTPTVQKKAQLFMAADLPPDFVPRPKEFKALKDDILHGARDRPTAITAALQGAGGYGKTTLALALCHDKDIRAAFPDGILWVTLGEQSQPLIGKIEDLLYLLSGERPSFSSLEAAMTGLKSILTDRSLLLVIDDVWRKSDLTPFLEEESRCARLVTTRRDSILPPNATRIAVDAMRQNEAVQLLQSGLENQQGIEDLKPIFHKLSSRLGEWPLLLTLANGVLRERVTRLGEPLSTSLTYIQRTLDKRGVVAFDAKNALERREAVARTLELSIAQLDSDEQERYEELAIFPEAVSIHLTAVQRLWQATGRLDELDTDSLCQHLFGLSLLLSYDLKIQCIRLHEVVRSYLQTRAKIRLHALQGGFLDAYGISRWALLPLSEPYLWDHLARHLLAAEREDILITTVKDLHYLAKKIMARGTSTMEQDLALAAQQAPDDITLGVLGRQIARIAHLLSNGQTQREVESILICRLSQVNQLQALCAMCEQETAHPWLIAWNPLPDLGHPALIRTLHGHTGSVNSCAVSPDGTWLVSASADGTLKVWDAHTGALRLTLGGHTDGVTNCAVSPDGSWLVSASLDGTLKLWDTRTGALRLTLQGHTDGVTSCAVSPDGDWLASVSLDGTLKLWDAHISAERVTLKGHTDVVMSCAVSPDGSWLVSASDDGNLKLWDARIGLERFTRVVRADRTNPVDVWDEVEYLDLQVETFEGFTLESRSPGMYGCAVSPDGIWFVSASADGALRVWDADTGALRLTLEGHAEAVMSCAVSPDGSWLVSASADGTLKVWDVHTGVERLTLKGHTDLLWSCAVSPSGRWIASTSDDGVLELWDGNQGLLIASFCADDSLYCCAFHPDETHLVAGGNSGMYFLRIVW